jgi:hypothetical protein
VLPTAERNVRYSTSAPADDTSDDGEPPATESKTSETVAISSEAQPEARVGPTLVKRLAAALAPTAKKASPKKPKENDTEQADRSRDAAPSDAAAWSLASGAARRWRRR